LLEIALSRLYRFRVRDVIINTHHFADMVATYVKSHDFGMRIEISREEELLDTGGGLKKAAHFFLEQGSDQPFLVHNVDVVSAIDLQRMIQWHGEHQALATLAVQHRNASRQLLFDEQLQLCGRKTDDSPPELVHRCASPQPLAFCGIHVISPRIFSLMGEEGVFSIITSYLRLAQQGERIIAFRADDYYWRDVGKPRSVEEAVNDLQRFQL
jgi:NDP-sugar pyrophosphorylase family protein